MKFGKNRTKFACPALGGRWRSCAVFTLSFLVTLSSTIQASPWLEASDPFLRSSLVLLSDSGKTSAPVSHYPLRWSTFADDLSRSHAPYSHSVNVASSELKYSLSSAKLNRANRRAKFFMASDQPHSTGFGQFSRDEWGSSASYEHLDSNYAFRLTTGYSRYNEENDINWDDSYFSLNAGSWLFSVGTIDRWWGHGWQHNLTLGNYANATPDIQASYIGKNEWLGTWSFETFIAKPKKSTFDYHSATRVVAKPFKRFEFGMTYQNWFDEWNDSDRDEQFNLDTKLTLPTFLVLDDKDLYHSIYIETASKINKFDLGVWLAGWTGSVDIYGHTLRLVLETQQNESEPSNLSDPYPSTHKGVNQNTYLLDDSYSISTYLQLDNDHKINVSYQESRVEQQDETLTQASYHLPALSGMLHFGSSYLTYVDSKSKKQHDINFWTGYEFRF